MFSLLLDRKLTASMGTGVFLPQVRPLQG
jgi:hypothetical protein